MKLLILKDTKVLLDFRSGLMGNAKGAQGDLTEASLDPYRVFEIKSGTICFYEID